MPISYCPICGGQKGLTHGDQLYKTEICGSCQDLCDDCNAKLEGLDQIEINTDVNAPPRGNTQTGE